MCIACGRRVEYHIGEDGYHDGADHNDLRTRGQFDRADYRTAGLPG